MPEDKAIEQVSPEGSNEVLARHSSTISNLGYFADSESSEEPHELKCNKRISKLAMAKWPYFSLWGKCHFDYVERSKEQFKRDSSLYENVLKVATPLKLVEVSRPTSISYYHGRCSEMPKTLKLKYIPPIPLKPQRPCPKRLCALAKPRRNWKDARKRELEKYNSIYKVPASALKAEPSARVLELSKPKPKLEPKPIRKTTKITKSSAPLPRVAGLAKAKQETKIEKPVSPKKPTKDLSHMKKRRTLVDVVQDHQLISPATLNRRMSQVHTMPFPFASLQSLQQEESEPFLNITIKEESEELAESDLFVSNLGQKLKSSISGSRSVLNSLGKYVTDLIEDEDYSTVQEEAGNERRKSEQYLKSLTKGVLKLALRRPKKSKLL